MNTAQGHAVSLIQTWGNSKHVVINNKQGMESDDNIIEGNKIKNIEALANPDVLKQYKNLKQLKT